MPKFILDVAVKSGSADKARNELKKLQDGIKKTDREVDKFDKSVRDVFRTLQRFGPSGIGIGAAFVGLTNILKESIVQFAEFETGLTKVERIAKLSADQVRDLSDAVSGLSKITGESTQDILKFAETGARFGLVGDELKDFTKTLTQFSAVSGGITEATARQFAKLRSITDSSGVSFGELANAVVSLGQSFPTTEAQILRTSTRLAQDLAEFGVTTEFVLGLGTAIEASGLGAERASTAFGQVTRSLLDLQRATDIKGQENFKDLANSVGETAESFRSLIINDPASAVIRLIENGPAATLVLKKLGENGTRTAGSIGLLSQASDLLRRALDNSNGSISGTSELTEQLQKQLATLDGQWKRTTAQTAEFAREAGGPLSKALKSVLLVYNDYAELVSTGEVGNLAVGVDITQRGSINESVKSQEDLQRAESRRAQQKAAQDRELEILQDTYRKSIVKTISDIDKLTEAEAELSRKRGLEGIELELDDISSKYDALREKFQQKYNIEFSQIPDNASEEQKREFSDRWTKFFDDLKGWYSDALKDAGKSALKDLEKDLKGLKEDYQDIVDRENEQRREFNKRKEGQVGATSLIEAAQFDIERAELERDRAEEIKERRKEHAENRKDAKAIKDEIVDVQEEIKKARDAAGATGTVSATK